jgi:trans-2,3-dihydro-3-hydroxyanthranilate isomerase
MPPEPSHPYEILDVFTDTPLQGNPLAVFTEGEHIPSRLMQPAARELNLSETVFLLPGDAECDAHIRIFTPQIELPFAGRPTLGSAFVVAARTGRTELRLRMQAGIVRVELQRDDHDGELAYGEMAQPLPRIDPFPADLTDALLAALGGAVRPELPIEAYTNGPTHVLVALSDVEQLSALEPDHGALARLGQYGINCFARTGETECRTRMFGAGVGVIEDPATGSAAGPIAVHLLRHGLIASGVPLDIRQGVEMGRPSLMRATASGTPTQLARVTVGGSAVVVGRGHFRLG